MNASALADIHRSVTTRACAGSVVFDLISMWRLDSGDYEAMAEAVISAWEKRCRAQPDLAPPRPKLMNSNISDVEEALGLVRCARQVQCQLCLFQSFLARASVWCMSLHSA